MKTEEEVIERLKKYIKEKKIPYKFLAENMDYTPEHICKNLAENYESSMKFNKLLIMAVCSFVTEDYLELKNILGESSWESKLISLF